MRQSCGFQQKKSKEVRQDPLCSMAPTAQTIVCFAATRYVMPDDLELDLSVRAS